MDKKVPNNTQQPGMNTGGAVVPSTFTLRDTFAMHAIEGLINCTDMAVDTFDINNSGAVENEVEVVIEDDIKTIVKVIAHIAYLQADAMIAERNKNLKYKKKGLSNE